MSKIRLIITSIISIVLVSVLLIGSTYSIFTTQEIDEKLNVYKTGNLSIKYATSGNVQIDFIPMNEEEADGINPYRITVTNNGNVPYQFDVILTDTTSSTDNTIDYQYIMTKVGYLDTKSLSNCTNNIIKEDVILPAGKSVDIDIRVWISDTVLNSEIGKSFYAKLSIDGQAIMNDNEEINNDMLSLRYLNSSTTSNFKSDTYKTYIKTASFVDYINTSNASLDATTNEKIMWDMTTNTTHNTNKVIAWLEDNGTTDDGVNKYYDLYIGSNEKIYATTLADFFAYMNLLENINFDNLDTSLTTIMYGVFTGCSSLTSLDLSSFDTSNVTQFSSSNVNNINHGMFHNCSSLESLDISNFDTSKVVYMQAMFMNCNNLVNLDLSSFDTSSVITMDLMFNGCSSLTSLDLSSFDTSKVTNMNAMFSGGSSLTSIDLSNFDTSSVITMSSMFKNCSSLTSLDLSEFNTSKITTMNSMFYNCSSLESLDISNFNTSNVTDMFCIFLGCSSLISLDLSNFDTIVLSDIGGMFEGCINLMNLDLNGWDTSNVTNIRQTFKNCPKLITEITITSNNISSYKDVFSSAATEEGSSITVYYVGDNPTTTDVNESTESLVDAMIATKYSNSNVVKGGCVGNYCPKEEETTEEEVTE